jgi:hypothetical protein
MPGTERVTVVVSAKAVEEATTASRIAARRIFIVVSSQ